MSFYLFSIVVLFTMFCLVCFERKEGVICFISCVYEIVLVLLYFLFINKRRKHYVLRTFKASLYKVSMLKFCLGDKLIDRCSRYINGFCLRFETGNVNYCIEFWHFIGKTTVLLRGTIKIIYSNNNQVTWILFSNR